MRFKEKFFSRLDKDGPAPRHRPWLGRCWMVRGARGRQPRMKFHGRPWLMSRVAFVLKYGRIPAGENVLHRRDVAEVLRLGADLHAQEGKELVAN